MAITDNLVIRVQPVVGDTAIKNIVNNTSFIGTGTPTLVNEGAEKAWSIATGTLLKNTSLNIPYNGGLDSEGLTIAIRFKMTALGTDSFLPIAGLLKSGDAANAGMIFTANGASAFRARLNSSTGTAATSSKPNNTIHTLVYKFKTLATTNSDVGELWFNRVGRPDDAPDAVSTSGNALTATFVEAMINCQTNGAYLLLDFLAWDVELSQADCAALADGNIRAMIPAPSGGTTPITFTGTIPAQTFTNGQSVSVDFTSYFSGTQTPFAFANTGASLAASGLSLSSAGLLTGTYNGTTVTGVIVTGTDASSNTVSSNAFNIALPAAVVPQGTVTLGTITKTSTTATIPYTYSAADQTGFEYRLNGGAPVADAASPVDLTGLTASTSYTIEVRAVNAAGSGTWSTVGNFTTDAAAQVPQGTVTIGSITTTQITASVPYTYSLADQTGFQYRLNGGTATTATASPQSLTVLAAGTSYTVEIRAINATGSGTWSAVANFTTAAAATITLTDLVSIQNVAWASQASITCDVYNPSTGALVVRKTGLSSTAGADISFTDAALTAATNYTVVISFDDKIGVAKVTT